MLGWIILAAIVIAVFGALVEPVRAR